MHKGRVILPGGAGLVGQNLIARLRARGWHDILVLDKHGPNLEALRTLQPEVCTRQVDLAEAGSWMQEFAAAEAVVMLQAQIGGHDYGAFERNNLTATAHILEAVRRYAVPRLVHISSSVVESVADDFYTRTKKAQEAMVRESGIVCPILRPTLMFGWFDRKHLGWLSRFMHRSPVFPLPGDGRYPRQPLYVGDFCNIILRCIEQPFDGVYNISGLERVDYVDIIREIRRVTGAHTAIVPLPYRFFQALLWLWGCIDRNPPFTTQQLAALVAGDEFELIDWPGIFGVRPTPFREAIEETFTHPRFSRVVMEF